MEHHTTQFAWEVFNNWAGYFTGGGIMAVITFWHSWREKPMRKKLLIGITILFFMMGTYKAWEEQYEKAESAGKNSDDFKLIANEYKSRFDRLSDALLITNTESKSLGISATASNLSGVGVISGSGNNIAFGGNNQFGNGNVQYNSITPKPYIRYRYAISSNVPDGKNYKTTILVEIINPNDGIRFLYKKLPSLIGADVKTSNIFMTFIENGPLNGGEATFTFTTSEKVNASDFDISIADTNKTNESSFIKTP